jgi:hypothetical protein
MLNEDGNNYEIWSIALMLMLCNQGLWAIVDGTKPSPDMMTNTAAHKEWCIKDQEAQLIILLALKKVSQKCVYCAKTSKQYWDCICAWYSGSSNRRTVSLLE